ncbi:MAG TPA: GTPase HflX [Vitreimonas sp.]|nr:GTPase HflX [Vitreimonas sp.]
MSQRFLLLQVITPHYHQDAALRNMSELEQLVTTYGGETIEKSIQHRVKPHPATYIGSGKLEWLKETVKEKKIDVVVINSLVNAGQLFRLTKALWEVNTRIAVWDRVDLILNIFDQHATTTEAKLQIQLARVEHTGPLIYGLGKTELSRQGGGIGTRGAGETNIEKERRNIKKLKYEIQQQLKQRTAEQAKRIQQRQAKGIRTVALVGYTSAGKTTLFNALTSKNRDMNQALFTTLDSVVGKLKISEYDPTVLVSDTIGFIDELPPALIDAFRTTLMESLAAKILLHVIDVSDDQFEDKMMVVDKILTELNADQSIILVFNKIDKVGQEKLQYLQQKYAGHDMAFVSAYTKQGIDELKREISQRLGIKLYTESTVNSTP